MRIIDIPSIPGDPDAMRRVAKQLERLSGDIHRISDEPVNAVDRLVFKSKFRNRLVGFVGELAATDRSQAVSLTLLAAEVRTKAVAVERAQQDREDLIERLRREEAERMRSR